jgi:hypothetical protein
MLVRRGCLFGGRVLVGGRRLLVDFSGENEGSGAPLVDSGKRKSSHES